MSQLLTENSELIESLKSLSDDELLELENLLEEEEHETPLSFREFIARVAKRYAFYGHCERLIAVLQRVADGELRRVMVFMPPRHSKSETVSRLLPAYYLYRYPERFVGLASYSSGLAENFSRLSRERFLEIGGALKEDSAQIKHWETTQGGGMWVAGVGGSITGKGFHLGIIDDPLKNSADAQSDRIRAKQIEWWQSTFATREEPGGAIVIVQTRWHQGDLSGFLLDEERRADDEAEAEGWHIVNMPAIAETRDAEWPATCTLEHDPRKDGEALCPERYPIEKLKKTMRRVGDYFWAALYQCRPAPSAGSIFKAADLCVDDNGPHSEFWPWPVNERIREAYLSGDTAVSANVNADMTAIALSFLASDGWVYLYPLVLGRMEIDGVVRECALSWARMKKRVGDPLAAFRLETGSAGTPALQQARSLMMRARATPTPEQLKLDEKARKKPVAQRSVEEQAAMRVVADSYPPNDNWTSEEWDIVRRSVPMVISPYSPGGLTGGGKGNIETRANEVTPFISTRGVRLCADNGNRAVARKWLQQLLAFPNSAHDDAVQSTIGGILPFVLSLIGGNNSDERIDDDLLGSVMRS